MDGSITNSQSLNQFSYVQGNPISLTDPFGLSPNISISGIGHAALDLLGIIPGFDFCDAINTAWYLKEGDYENAALSAAACIPLFGSVVGSGIKWGAKGVANAEKVADTVKLGSRIVGDGGAMLLSGGQAVESARQVYTNITNGEGLTWKNAVDVITLGISVAGMGMAGASIAKSGKSLSAMYKGETAVSNVATSNATKGVSAAAESASDPYALLEGKAGFTPTLSAEEIAACDLVGVQMSADRSGKTSIWSKIKNKIVKGKTIDVSRISYNPTDDVFTRGFNSESVSYQRKYYGQYGKFDCSQEPIVVYDVGNGNYMMQGGHHRLKAAKDLGLESIKVSEIIPYNESVRLGITDLPLGMQPKKY